MQHEVEYYILAAVFSRSEWEYYSPPMNAIYSFAHNTAASSAALLQRNRNCPTWHLQLRPSLMQV